MRAALFLFALASLAVALSGCGGSAPGSVGAVFGRDNETRALYVREAPPGLAASSAGVLPGDQVVMIEGVYVRDLDAKTIREKLRGEPGSIVSLTILRGEEVIHLRIPRRAQGDHPTISPKETRFRE